MKAVLARCRWKRCSRICHEAGFATLAQQELEEARRFYNRQQSGLGTAFLRETQKAAAHILQRPLAWPVEVDPVRRFIFDRFPYKMLYIVRGDLITVAVIAHQHRNPDYWVDRISTL